MPMAAAIAIDPISVTTKPNADGFGRKAERHGQHKAGIGADHINVAMGEIDQPQDAVNHRVAERDERVDRSDGQAVDQLLNKSVHN